MKRYLFLFFISIFTSAGVFAADNFECNCNDGRADQSIVVTREKVWVAAPGSDSNSADAMKFTAKFDPHYKSKGGRKKARFKGKERGEPRDVILEESMLDGASGYMQIRGDSDGFWSLDYYCRHTE